MVLAICIVELPSGQSIVKSHAIRRALSGVERRADGLKRDVKRKLGLMDPLRIQAFRTWARGNRVWIKGRVLEDKGLSSREGSHMLEVVRETWHRYESDEMPGARVRVEVGDDSHEVTTDEEGFFELEVDAAGGTADGPWRSLPLTLLSPLVDNQPPSRVAAKVRQVGSEARFGVISDMDDTVIRTGATDFLKRLRIELFRNAHSREAFPGVSAFYRALSDDERNPFFYVSSSAWNLFDLFDTFMQVHGIPPGPILLKEMGLTRQQWLKSGHDDYKLERIATIMDAFPDLDFILVGDSGQRDPFIYREVVRRYPGRVLAVYIRDVSDAGKDEKVRRVKLDLVDAGIDLLLLQDTLDAARHAADRGWIEESTVKAVAGKVSEAIAGNDQEG